MKLNIPRIKQIGTNDCWICCAAMIYNYFCKDTGAEPIYYGKAYGGEIPEIILNYASDRKLNPTAPQSASDFLAWTGLFKVPADSRRLPKFEVLKPKKPEEERDTIVGQIDREIPLLCLVKDVTWAGGRPDLKCQDGHWIVICGYLETRLGNTLLILDPDQDAGDLVTIPYDDKTYLYCNGMYFQNTTYLEIK